MLFLYILYDRFLRSPQNGAIRIAALINKDGLLRPDRAFAPRLPIALKRLPETHLKELKSIKIMKRRRGLPGAAVFYDTLIIQIS